MAQFKSLVVSGAARVVGKIYAREFVGALDGTSDSALKDGLDQNIANTYIKGLSVSGTTITMTYGDDDTDTLTTQDTTYSTGTSSVAGLTKLYSDDSGTNTDGTITQNGLKTLLANKVDTTNGVAPYAVSDSLQQRIDTTYIKDVTPTSGTTELVLKLGNNTTKSINTKDTTYSTGTGSVSGLTKLFDNLQGESTEGTLTQAALKTEFNGKLSTSGNAASATKATNDSEDQNIADTYIKGLSVSGTTITYTKGDNDTGTITTQDTTYSQATTSTLGLVKLFTSTGSAVDGTMTQDAITTALSGKLGTSDNAASATKASNDSADQNIADTYIKGLSVSGTTITITKGDDDTSTITTQDTTYSQATDSDLGLVKLYGSTGTNTDGTITQSALKTALDGKLGSTETAAAATKDGADQVIASTYIKDLSVSGTTITMTYGDDNTDTITTQDTTYSTGTTSTAGITKLYDSTGTNTDGTMTQDALKTALDGKLGATATAAAATKATNDSADQNIADTYIKGLSVNGTTITYTKGDDDTGTITTQDTTYSTGTTSTAGITKLYTSTGSGTDGTMTQSAITTALSNQDTTLRGLISNINSFEIVILGSEEDLPETGTTHTVYFVPLESQDFTSETGENFAEYMWIEVEVDPEEDPYGYYEQIGVTSADLGNYYTKTEVEGLISDNNTSLANTYSTKANTVSGLSVSGTTITVTKDNGSTSTITTQDTTYSTGTTSTAGLTKLYDATGTNTDGTMTQSAIKTELDGKLGTSGNAASATKATNDSEDQNIADTYIKGLSVSGTTITYTKGDNDTGTIATQDTTYSTGTASVSGLTKLYTSEGTNTDGTMTQDAIKTALAGKMDVGSSMDSAAKDGLGQNIADTYVKGLSVSGTTVTFTFGDGDTSTITTQDTTYSTGTASTAGLTKLYTSTGTATDGTMTQNAIKTELDGKLGSSATAVAATKATNDSLDQNISDTYIKGISISGTTVTITKGDNDTATVSTQDTTYSQATTSTLGLVKLYTSPGTGTDGTMTRTAITNMLDNTSDNTEITIDCGLES